MCFAVLPVIQGALVRGSRATAHTSASRSPDPPPAPLAAVAARSACTRTAVAGTSLTRGGSGGRCICEDAARPAHSHNE